MIWSNEDAIAAIKATGGSMDLSEVALKVLESVKATGVSMVDFKIRQETVDALNGKYHAYKKLPFDRDDQQLAGMFDELVRIHYEERMRKMSEEAVARFHNAMVSLPNSRILPITMEIDGVTTKVGDALIDSTDGGFCIMHAVIDGKASVAELFKTDFSQLSIGNKDDFKTKEH